MIDIAFDYNVTAEVEFLRWLDSISVSMDGLPIERPTKSLDERIAEKEKRIKRKIDAHMYRQRNKVRKLSDAKLDTETVDAWIQQRLEI